MFIPYYMIVKSPISVNMYDLQHFHTHQIIQRLHVYRCRVFIVVFP